MWSHRFYELNLPLDLTIDTADLQRYPWLSIPALLALNVNNVLDELRTYGNTVHELLRAIAPMAREEGGSD